MAKRHTVRGGVCFSVRASGWLCLADNDALARWLSPPNCETAAPGLDFSRPIASQVNRFTSPTGGSLCKFRKQARIWGRGLSRRSFIRGSALTTAGVAIIEAASAVVRSAEAIDAHPAVVAGLE